MEEIIYKSSKGYVVENKKENTIRIFEDGMALYDGIPDRFTTETKINYKTGLWQRWAVTGYQVLYDKKYENNRNGALEDGKKMVS